MCGGETRRCSPIGAQFLVEFSVEGPADTLRREERGIVELNGRRESYAYALWRQVARLLVRESKF